MSPTDALDVTVFEEHAHNRPGLRRAARRAREFLRCMAVRNRALCASDELLLGRPMPSPTDLDQFSAHVIRVIAQTQRIPQETVQLNSTFEELKIDSLDGINLVFALENEFGINIPDEGVRSLRSVRETVEGVRRLVEEKEQASAAAPVNTPPAAHKAE